MQKFRIAKIPLFVFTIFIACLSLFFRLLWLDRVPTGISNDELDNVLNAKAVFFTGSDLSGAWSPFSLSPISTYYDQSELAAIVISPILSFLPLNLFSARLPFAIASTISVVFIFLIANKLLGKNTAVISGIVSAINPWFIFIGRSGLDVNLSLMFCLIAIYLLLRLRRIYVLLAFIPLFLAFYTYIGSKLIVLPLSIICIFYAWKYVSERKYLIHYLTLLGMVIFLIYAPFFLLNSTNRSSEVLSPSHQSVAKRVDYERKQSVVSPLRSIFSNKLTTFGREFEEKYLGVFSIDYLFLHGDPKFLFSVFDHGVFYLQDVLFLIVGGIALFLKKRREFLFILALILIAPLPSAFSTVGSSYVVRSFLLHPLLIILISFGIFTTISHFKASIVKAFVLVGIVGLYLIFISNFMYIYFARNPIANSESFNFSSRILANYLLRETQDSHRQIIVLTQDPQIPFRHLLFYGNLYNKDFAAKVGSMYKSESFKYDNISFLECKNLGKLDTETTVITDPGTKCYTPPKTITPVVIPQLSDGGAIYKIWNGQLCNNLKLGRYPENIKFSDFSVEKLINNEFCQKFISHY